LTWLLEAPGKIGGCVTASVALAPKRRHGSDGHGHSYSVICTQV
jgi:hypothetical protein